MLLAESTVDAEAAQSVDCSKMLVNSSCNFGVDLAVMVVEAANCLVGCVSSRGFEQKEHRKLNSLSIGSAHAF